MSNPSNKQPNVRGDRSEEDFDRKNETGTAMSFDERMQIIRQELDGNILPDINQEKPRGYDPEMHYFWASTTNQTDTVYKRQRLGYEFVKASDFPDMTAEFGVKEGQFQGCISIREMLLMKIPKVIANEILRINHHEKPLQEEMRLKANAVDSSVQDKEGKRLGQIADEDQGFQQIVNERRAPKSFV